MILFTFILLLYPLPLIAQIGGKEEAQSSAQTKIQKKLPLGMSEDLYNYDNINKIITDHNGLTFKPDATGIIKINGERYLAFGLKGSIGSTTFIKTSVDYQWTWHIDKDGNNYIFWAENNDTSFIWRQYYYFFEDPFKPMKIKHYVENNFVDATDIQMYYFFNILQNDLLTFNATQYSIKDSAQLYKTGDFSNVVSSVNFNSEYDFIFDDLVDKGFVINEFYLGNGNLINYPSADIMAIGFKKNDGLLPKGTYIVVDPTFSTNTVKSLRNTAINGSAFAIAWCDATQNDVTYAVYHADGNTIVAATDVANIGNCGGGSTENSVSIATFNKTTFVIGWGDGNDIINFSIVNWESGEITRPNIIPDDDAEGGVGSADCVSVSTLNSTHFIEAWINRKARDINVSVYNVNGIRIDEEQVSDVGEDTKACSSDTFNATHFVVGWYDDEDTDAEYRVFRLNDINTISAITGVIDVDINAGGTTSSGGVEIATFNSTHFVYLYFDATDDDVSFEIHDITGSEILSEFDIKTDGNLNSNMDIDVDTLNQTAFVIVFEDDPLNIVNFTIYSSSGNQILKPTQFDGSFNFVSVAAKKNAINIGFCDNNFILASNSGKWQANRTNGSSWDGSCIGPPSPPGPANENEGIAAIGAGIQNSLLDSYINYTYQQIYARKLDNTQDTGTFDRVARKGNKTWAFNYVTGGEEHIGMFNLTPVLYILEMSNITSTNITNVVEVMINVTK